MATLSTFAVYAQAPSNIAFLKYWGKDNAEAQWASNDSISMTLSSCYSRTQVQVLPQAERDTIYLENKLISPTDQHGAKIHKHLAFLRQSLAMCERLEIRSSNSFPMALGIASSASGMAALTLACLACWTRSSSWEELAEAGWEQTHIASLARHGSGSACRSFWGGIVKWERGVSPQTQRVYQLLNEKDWALCDIVVFPRLATAKQVSSTTGHARAKTSPLFALRVKGMAEKVRVLQQALQKQDFRRLGMLIEQEALEFYQIMLTSTPPLNYLTSETLAFLLWVRACRANGEFEAYFTIDAGMSVHLLCMQSQAEEIKQKIQRNFDNFMVIVDKIGGEPTLGTDIS